MGDLKIQDIERVNLLGVGIHTLNMEQATSLAVDNASDLSGNYICVTGVHGIMETQKNPDYQKIFNSAFLTVPDGMPTVWWGRLHGFKKMDRVYGPDLMLAICESSVEKNQTHFLYGGDEGVAEKLKGELEQRYPGIKILGTSCPPFRSLSEDEERALSERMDELKPNYFWVGLGVPKQENFMGTHQHLKVGIMIGVGAAFDYHTGRLIDSPSWLKRIGLQWLHRLIQEPKRLWRRYLIYNPIFLWKSLLQYFGIQKY